MADLVPGVILTGTPPGTAGVGADVGTKVDGSIRPPPGGGLVPVLRPELAVVNDAAKAVTADVAPVVALANPPMLVDAGAAVDAAATALDLPNPRAPAAPPTESGPPVSALAVFNIG